jgi:GNAT superfamily N-acetyltransferase
VAVPSASTRSPSGRWSPANRARRISDVLRPVTGGPALSPRVEMLPPEAAGDAAVVAALVRVVNAAYAAGEAGLWAAGTPWTDADEIAAAVGGGEMIAAFGGDGDLVGCARVRPLAPDVVDLGFVSVAPEAWGTGVGRAVLAFAEDVVRRSGVPTMQLELLVPQGAAHPDKERLRAWYLRLGYEIVRTAPFEEVARHAATQLATPCEFLVFHKMLR